MFNLTKEFKFEAAHKLPKHDGKCARLHGHSFVGEMEFTASGLHESGPKSGMVLDFGDASAAVKPLLEESLDHHYLNDTTGLANPTSEELARWVFDQLAPKLPLLTAVTIRETCTSACTYRP